MLMTEFVAGCKIFSVSHPAITCWSQCNALFFCWMDSKSRN